MELSSGKKIIIGFFLLCFIVLFGRLFQLQILQGFFYSRLATDNAAKVIPIIAPRGIVYDRFGKVIVSNRPIFSVFALPDVLASTDVGQTVNKLSRIIKMPPSEIIAKIKDKKNRPFDPVLLKDDLSPLVVTRLEEQRNNLKGIVVRYRPVRDYPNKSTAAHIVGYVGEVSQEDLFSAFGTELKPGDLIGKAGIERYYDFYLRGKDGGQKIEVDVHGRPVRIMGFTEPEPGKNVKLTIDLELQKKVEDLLKGYSGAVVILDLISGEVLALASSPTFDPDIFNQRLSAKEWKQMDKRSHPFLNRAISAYPAGSIFKPFTLAAALDEKLVDPGSEVFNCRGFYKLGGRIAKCWKEDGHGSLGALEGLVWSCDVVFYELGHRAGIELMSNYARRFGLGEKTRIDLPQEKTGLIPDLGWKERVVGQPWYPGDYINIGIGQGFIQVTPLQMAVAYGEIATGIRYIPHLLKDVLDRSGNLIYSYEPVKAGENPISEISMEKIRTALREVVRRGTGVAARVLGFPAAGKTGTAENSGKPHAWFICYAPYFDPQISVAVFVENGEHGDRISAQIAGKILEWYKKYRLAPEFVVDEKPEQAFPPQTIKHGL